MAEEPVQCAVMLRRRERIIGELLMTEDAYRKQLQVMVDYFETPMRIQQVIPNHAIDAIFGNVHQLIRVNHELRAYLEDHEVGEAFLKIGPFLKLYSVYAKNHHHALSTYEEWEHKSTRFVELKHRQECRPEVKMKFNALLITPVQRIPRYKLLLDDLLNYTLPTHADYPQLKQACEEIALVASHINNFIREHDNFNKMLQIQRSLSGNCAPKILGPGRKFIMEGPLKRVSRKGGRAYERMFFLFSDMLLYAKPRLVENGSHAYSCCCVLPLHHCNVERMFGGQSGGAMIRLSCKEEVLLLYHEDREQIESWIIELKKAIKEVCQSRQSLHKESSARRPMRKPDLARTKRQERLEKIRDENQASQTPDKENTSPLVKYVRNLTDIDSLCCTPKKKLNLDLDATIQSQAAQNETQCTTVTEDSFSIADQSEVENFDVTLPQYFRKLDIGHEETETETETEIEDDLESVTSRTSAKRTMRRSLSNLSQYSTRLRSSFRTLRQKTSSCSLRVKPRHPSGRTRLQDIFQNPDAHEFQPTELADESEATNQDAVVRQVSSTNQQQRNSVYGSEEILVANACPPNADSTNITPRKLVQPIRDKLSESGANRRATRRLKRGLGQMVNHVMSPVLESTPVRGPTPALGGYTMVSDLNNVRHLADSVHTRETTATACLVM